jgi:hypothetical protein
MDSNTQIKCPNCGTNIDVQDILAKQLEEDIRKKYQSQLLAEKTKFEKESLALEMARKDFEEKKKKENILFQERFEAKLKEERKMLEIQLKSQLQSEQAEQYQALQKELNEKSEQIKELNRTKAEIEKLKREKEEIKEIIEAESQKRINETLLAERERIVKAEEAKNELRFKELQKQLEDQRKLTEEMKRKQEQGSMQLQGEVQELAIEEWLSAKFPLDTIEEIKKGARGGDCLQIVNTLHRQNCGTLYYESKRTKEFQWVWIEKLKADMREKSADVGILVTETMPNGWDRMGIHEGVWICTYEEFKGLCTVLRESVIQLSAALASEENKGDKMEMLYGFLTSTTFKMQVEAIVEGFSAMKNNLESEKRSMQRIWKEREKQIDKVIANTIDMYGSIRGIAGSAVQSVRALELPGDESTEGSEE